MNIALVLSGGVGTRFNASTPKQYLYLNKKRIIEYVIESSKQTKYLDKIIVVAHKKYESLIKDEFDVEWAEAGDERNKTLKKGLDYINKHYKCNKVIILDAVRPFVKSELIDCYIELLDTHQAVTTAKKITDSLGCYDMHEVDRERYYLLSSPEAFQFDVLYKYFNENSKLTEVIHQLPESTVTYLNFDIWNNLKITFPEDILLAKLLLEQEK